MAECALRQAALHMMRHPGCYYPCIEQQLLETGESFESYVCNIYHGKVWGDDLVAAGIWGHVEYFNLDYNADFQNTD